MTWYGTIQKPVLFPLLTITTLNLPNGQQGTAYSATMSAIQGTLPYSWSGVFTGLGAAGLSISKSGAIGGTPTSSGAVTATITVTDNFGSTATHAYSLNIASNQPVITTASLPNAQVGTAYSFTCAATGGVPPYTWAITSDTPDTGGWLSIGASTGTLSGTPGTAETESLTLQVTDSLANPSAPTNLALTVQGSGSIVFDFFVSPTGSSSNPGTLAAPWDIGSLGTKGATYAGKKVGLIGSGNPASTTPDFDVSSLNANSVLSFNTPLFSIPAGTSGHPTYLAACNSSGQYVQRGTWIQAKTPGGTYTGTDNQVTPPQPTKPGSVPREGGIFGNVAATGASYITIDGLRMSGVRSTLLTFGSVGTIGSYGCTGCATQNCELFDCNDTLYATAAGNYSSVQPFNQVGFIFQNNYVHDMYGFSANSSANNGHDAAFMTWYCKDTIIQNNTCVNGAGFYGKEAYSQGTVIRWNYVDNHLQNSGEGVTNFSGNNDNTNNSIGLTDTTQIYNNIFYVYGNPLRLVPNLHQDGGQGWATPLQIYSNTFIWANANVCGLEAFAMPGTTAVGGFSFYNNLMYGPKQTNEGTTTVNPAAVGTWAYNVYQSTALNFFLTSNTTGNSAPPVSTYTTIAAAQAGFGGNFEKNSITTTQTLAQLFTQSGQSAAQFKLLAGSNMLGAGYTTGTGSGGATCDVGAWGGASPPTVIGSTLNGVPD